MADLLAQVRADNLTERILGFDRFIAGLLIAARNRDDLADKARASDRETTACGVALGMSAAEKRQRTAAAELRNRAALAQADRDALVKEQGSRRRPAR